MTTTQIKIEENGEWKATVNTDELGNVVQEWGEGDDIEKIIIVKKEPERTDEEKEIAINVLKNELEGLSNIEIPEHASEDMKEILKTAQAKIDGNREFIEGEISLIENS